MPASISTSLLTDMYELTMFDAALKAGTAWRTSTFEVFGRRLPATRRFGVVAGIGRILEALERFEFEPEQIDWLHEHKIVSDDALDYLKDFRFSGDMLGYAEGECYFPGSPLLTVHGTFAECTMLETLLLSILNYDCAVASAASRMTIAAHGRPCMDMGARRGHERAAVSAARAAIIGGFAGTSDLEAAKRYGLRAIGTAAHAFTLLHETEDDAFRAQLATMGPGTTLLVDTYDVEAAVERGVLLAREAGGELGAVRLDSGDLVAGTFKVRQQLDSLGATQTKITVTNDLDEYAIAALGAAPVDSYGVGTKLVSGSGMPTAALVYKLVAREGSGGEMVPVEKKSADKSTQGGQKWAGRVMADGTATTELLVTAPSREIALDYLAGQGARPLQHDFVVRGETDTSWFDAGALGRAAARHTESRNQLPYQAWRLSEGDPAIPTRLVNL